MGDIRIVNYDHSYAGRVADMWNKSVNNWGGNNAIRTEESVVREHDNSFNLDVFLALDNDEVVGYCSFSKYPSDEDSLFIPLLNVHPDYHGKKIGKALVMRAVERTAELGCPRLDLFTWPGNTKAVPLYKKCGFFWEKRDDSTHLMNFIPYVIGTEALSEYFEPIHWYNDSTRVIEVKPDGIENNGFVHYEYSWEKNGRKLRVEFERAARGLRLIETEDYLISTRVQEHELVFGRSYEISYHLVNKSGKPLNVRIKGLNNKNIEHDLDRSVDVIGETTLEGSFHVGEIYEEQNTWRTHPSVAAEVFINGRKAVFKTGILPKYPARISLIKPQIECYKESEGECYLEIENNFKEKVLFELNLPENGKLTFHPSRHQISLDKNERKTIALSYRLEDFCLYDENVPVKAILDSGEKLEFSKRVRQQFSGFNAMFGGEGESSWFIVNGTTAVNLSKHDNRISVSTNVREEFGTRFDTPKLGKPYSEEFFKKRADRVEFYQEGDAMTQRAYYTSGDFPYIGLVSTTKLYHRGLVEHFYEVYNNSEEEAPDEVALGEAVFHNLFRAVIPYEGKYIELQDAYEASHDFWDSSKITENWLFSRGDRLTRGICWPKNYEMKYSRNAMFFEHNFGKLAPNSSAKTESIWVAYGTYNSWQDFRVFALKEYEEEALSLAESFECIVNNGNPFIKGSFDIDFVEHKNEYFNGRITVDSNLGLFSGQEASFVPGENLKRTKFTIVPEKKPGLDILTLGVDFDSYAFEKEQGLYITGDGDVVFEVDRSDGTEVYSADNGVIQIKACPTFSHSVFSMTYHGYDWLDTSFPKPGPRSWFNPWVGGIGCRPWGMTPESIRQESKACSFVEIRDVFDNQWSGLRLNVKVHENKAFRGLEYNQYFLMQPGIPVLCQTVEVLQNTGKFLNHTGFGTECFLKPDEAIENSWFKSIGRDGMKKKYRSGRVAYNITSDSSLLYGSDKTQQRLQVFTDLDTVSLLGYANRNDTAAFITNKVTARDGERLFTQPIFYIFTEEFIEDKILKDLKNIRFK